MVQPGFFTTRRTTIIALMIAGLLLAGCGVETEPQDVAHFSTNRAATQDVAEYDGLFQLFGDDKDNVVGPLLLSAQLKKGEIVGFEIDQNHVPFAIAGKARLQLSAGRYRWQMTPTAGQVDWSKTDVVIVEVIVGAVVAVVAVVGAILAKNSL